MLNYRRLENKKPKVDIVCPHCEKTFTQYSFPKHESKCMFLKRNVLLILEYIKQCCVDVGKLNKDLYNDYAKEHNLPTASTLMVNLDLVVWSHTFPKLALEYYRKGFINDIEEIDFYILGKITFNGFGLNYQHYSEANELFNAILQRRNYDNSDGWKALYYAVLTRAAKDIIIQNEIDENGLVIDKKDAENFLYEQEPALYELIVSKYNIK